MKIAFPIEVLAETTDTDAAAIARLNAEHLDDAAKLAAKDDEIDAIKRRHASELAEVTAHSLDADTLDEAVASRIALIGATKSILGHDFDPSGKSEMMIRRLAVEEKLGGAMLTGKDDTYVTIVFDTLVATKVDINPAQTLISAGIQPNEVIAAYKVQLGIHNKLDSAAHGHADITSAIRLSFGWVQHGFHRQNQRQEGMASVAR